MPTTTVGIRTADAAADAHLVTPGDYGDAG
jgi:hypothetical protein